jgi:ribosomal protein S18 acetylase RimI-like enzyme
MSKTFFMFGDSYKKLRTAAVIIICLGLGAVFFWRQLYVTPIQSFMYQRDAQFIKDIFVQDWYWLVSDESDLSYDEEVSDIEQLLRHGYIEKRGGRGQEPAFIKMIVDDNKPQAFIVYYKQRAHRGYIQFLGVSPEARGKGYGTKLIKYALSDLFSKDCDYVYLTARLSNTKARSIYEAVGFKEKYRDEKYIEYNLFKRDFKA